MHSRSRLTAHQSRKFIERKKVRIITIAGLIVLCVFLFFYCLSTFSHLNFLTIQNIIVKGAKPSDVASLQSLAIKSLDGNYLGLFSKANTMFYPHDQIANIASTTLPSIKSLSIKRDGLQGLLIDVVEKDPSAIACTNLPDFIDASLILDASDNCYMVDNTGLIFDNTLPSSVPNNIAYNRYYIPSLSNTSTSTNAAIGMYATTTDEFISLQNFYNGAREANLKPQAILIKEGGEYEMYADNVVVYFNDSKSLNSQLSNLVSFWDSLVAKKDGSGNPSNFESIDVRYGSNVFYRKIK